MKYSIVLIALFGVLNSHIYSQPSPSKCDQNTNLSSGLNIPSVVNLPRTYKPPISTATIPAFNADFVIQNDIRKPQILTIDHEYEEFIWRIIESIPNDTIVDLWSFKAPFEELKTKRSLALAPDSSVYISNPIRVDPNLFRENTLYQFEAEYWGIKCVANFEVKKHE